MDMQSSFGQILCGYCENGQQYLKESLLKEDPLNFFGRKWESPTNWYLRILQYVILQGLSGKAFVSTKYPSPKAELRYMDAEEDLIYPNCFNYYYFDTKSYRKSKTTIQMKMMVRQRSLLRYLVGKKKYSLIDTLYCDMGKELMLADFSKGDYKNMMK